MSAGLGFGLTQTSAAGAPAPEGTRVEVKIIEEQIAGKPITFAIASFRNDSQKALCVPLYVWREYAETIEHLFYVYPDNETRPAPDGRISFHGTVVERSVPEDEFRVVAPGNISISKFAVSENFAFRRGKHRYRFTFRVFAPYCDVLNSGLLQLPTPLLTNLPDSDLSYLGGKGVLLTSGPVGFEIAK